MADFHLTQPDDNPAYTDPIYAEAHKPARRYLMFSSVLDANGEIKLERLEGEWLAEPAELIVQSINKPPVSEVDKHENGITTDSISG